MGTIWGVFVRKSLAVYDMSSKNCCPIHMFCKAVEKTFSEERSELFFSNLIAVTVWWEMSKMPKPRAKLEGIKASICLLGSSILHSPAFFILSKSHTTKPCALLLPALFAEYLEACQKILVPAHCTSKQNYWEYEFMSSPLFAFSNFQNDGDGDA
jgi:hypothetical protein